MLDKLPLELIREVGFNLPDAHSAMSLALTSRNLFNQLINDKCFFLHKWGSKTNKRFQKHSKTYNYYKYFRTVLNGQIKSTCSVCFEPKNATFHEGINRSLCFKCRHKNIIRKFKSVISTSQD